MLRRRVRGSGIRRTISISKTRKITASKKKRSEKGIRAEDFGSKPHSKGADFSRSIFFFSDKAIMARMMTDGKIIASKVAIKEVIISLE